MGLNSPDANASLSLEGPSGVNIKNGLTFGGGPLTGGGGTYQRQVITSAQYNQNNYYGVYEGLNAAHTYKYSGSLYLHCDATVSSNEVNFNFYDRTNAQEIFVNYMGLTQEARVGGRNTSTLLTGGNGRTIPDRV